MWEIDQSTVATNPEDGTQYCVAVNRETGETQEFAHERALEDAASFCYWGNRTPDEIREIQEPFGLGWQREQAERRGEVDEDAPFRPF
jgi:hypothetical protein